MAEFNSYLLGKARKSVGNITLCYMNKKNIAKAKVFSRKDNPTPEILSQRARMKALVQLGCQLLPVIRKGFIGIGSGSTSNAFVSANMKAVTVDEKYEATIDLDLLKIAAGLIYTPKVSVTYSDEGNKAYSFQQEMQEEEDGYACADDRIHAVLYESVLGRTRLATLKTRGESGSTSYPLPEDWDNKNVKVYCFATSKNGKRASDSRTIQ